MAIVRYVQRTGEGVASRQAGKGYRCRPVGFWLLFALPAAAGTLQGRVVKVADGDTITVQEGDHRQRIRLQGIDSPERGRPYGKAAGQEVWVEYDKRDRYGRIVGVVWVQSLDARCHVLMAARNRVQMANLSQRSN